MSGMPPLDGSEASNVNKFEGFQEDRNLINGDMTGRVANIFHTDQGVEYVGTLPYQMQKDQFPIDFEASKKLPKEMKSTAHGVIQAAKVAMRHLPPSPAAPAA